METSGVEIEGDPSRAPSPGAARTRRWRERRRTGTVAVHLLVTTDAIGLLTAGGWLDPRHAHDNDAISEALGMLAGTALYRRFPPRGWMPAEQQIQGLVTAH
jgi:hypothetical protein